ncbi:D-2-hydroxyacid dehydrogenase [Brachybacterium sacelli]|uniref:Phosphoglycerate dehydrogenase-like enzyme n=1 Tax=Brachybacterium sacelli TaxID=173364 RepID=A0ABS4WVS7_9MICO|nr:D-2-hydroxyacid dehydrogenase [Brachybacterium sacelli]MBP2380186.1 phosphoglycerate dehydrogenase-like enzyme [Brachybacterium sacelli]
MSTPEILLVRGEQPPEHRERIRAAAGGARVEFVPDLEEDPSLLARATAIAGGAPQGVLAAAPRVRWVHSWAAGPDVDLTDEVRSSDVVLTSSVGNGAIPLAEHAMLLMLQLDRDSERWARAQRERRWERHQHGELAGATLGLFGVGHAGADLAAKAAAFHMRVLGCRRRPSIPVPHVEAMYGFDQLHTFLAQCDVVVVSVPSTATTRGALDEAALRAMRPGAHLVCISRGGIIDDAALLRALHDGHLGGAGLDAHSLEPLPEDSPFWGAPRTIITPHNGATTPGTSARGFAYYLENVARFVQGRDLLRVVDKAAGY